MHKLVRNLLFGCLLAGPLAAAAGFDGDFVMQTAAGDLRLQLEESSDGKLSGVLSDGVAAFRLSGRTQGSVATGRVTADQPPALAFTARLDGDAQQLSLQLYPLDSSGNPDASMAENLAFLRTNAVQSMPGEEAQNVRNDEGGKSNVFINGKALTLEQVAGFEQQYQTRLVDGRYWYDENCGAWGLEGGPTAGFILPSLQLPGPMPAGISGGGTGIFINGRELHPVDRQVLVAMFGTALPGRYWLDSYGNLGPEGGGVLVNLAVAAQRMQQTTTHSSYGSVSTGSSGAMFSGTNLSTGKPTFWYAGM